MPFHRSLPSFLSHSRKVWRASFSHARPLLNRVVYGSALYSAPRRPTNASYPASHPLLTALRPFRRRLHGQRCAVGALRLCCGALLTVTASLLGCLVFGPAWPLLPLLSVVGIVLACSLVALVVRAPSWAHLALVVDHGLYLREQLESAVETVETTPVPAPGSMVARLQDHAVRKLQVAPLRALPWPSSHAERRLATVLGIATALSFWMMHNGASSTGGGGALAGGSAADAGARPGLHTIHGLLPTTTGRNGGKPITMSSPGRGHTGQTLRGAAPARGAGATGLGLTSLRTAASSSNASAHMGTAGTGQGQGQGQAQGRGSAAGAARTGTQRGAGSQSGAGTQPGAGAKHVETSSGANSPAGRLSNPAQSPLLSLQNSIDQAHQQGQNASSAGTAGTKGEPNPAGATTRKNKGGSAGSGRDRRPSTGAGARGDALDRSPSGAHGRQGFRLGPQNQSAGNEGVAARRGQAEAGSGSGHGASSHVAAANGSARLGQSQTITLGRSSGKAGQMLTIEAGPTQSGTGGGTLTLGGEGAGSTSAPLVTVPGYVASDDNTVAPALKAAMRGYFTPKATGP